VSANSGVRSATIITTEHRGRGCSSFWKRNSVIDVHPQVYVKEHVEKFADEEDMILLGAIEIDKEYFDFFSEEL
jgi:hypothetical protein